MNELLNNIQEQWIFALWLVIGFRGAARSAQRVGAGGSSVAAS
jgi:hypothetical protein